jgi:CBS domain containing-hemolysin-like protein
MALSEPVRILKLVVGFQVAFTWFFGPLIHFLNSNGNWFVRRFGIEPKEELSSARSPEELSSLVRRSAHLGSLEQDTAQLLEKTISLASLNASDVMTPRPKMYSLSRDENATDLIELARSTGHSRFPVSGEDEDDIVGVVHLKRAITIPLERRAQVPVSALMVEPLRVPETMPLDALILQLRGKGLQFGVVIDEYGGTAGIVTLEDAIEELVGDLDDEHDKARSSVTKFSDGSLAFSGLLRPAELKEHGLVIAEDEDYDTVSGFIMSELEKIPVAGDQVKIPSGFLTVTRMDGRRVDRVRFEPIEVEDE